MIVRFSIACVYITLSAFFLTHAIFNSLPCDTNVKIKKKKTQNDGGALRALELHAIVEST